MDLSAVIAGLRGRGLACSVLRSHVAGELDVRLLVQRPGHQVSVELLGPPVAGDGVWDAVRVDGESRQVWRGSATQLATFLADLVALSEAALSERYLRLG